jgi:RecA-family ATPase
MLFKFKPVSISTRDVNGIKPNIRQELDGPPPGPGGRHAAITSLSQRMVNDRVADDVIFAELRKWIPDEDKKDKEFWDLINGAHKLAGSGSATYRGDGQAPTIKPIIPSDTQELSQFIRLNCSWQEFLRRAYYPGENIFIATEAEFNGEKWTPTGEMQEASLEQWLTSSRDFHPQAGAWIAINPFKDVEGRRTQDNVSAFRYVMIESDSRTKAQQMEDINNSGLPVAFVIDSGGDSLHAWIKVDAPNFEEWKKRRDTIYSLMSDCGFDSSNKDASRLSRLPGVMRGDNLQALVAENIGAKDWTTWEESNDGLPEDLDLAGLFETHVEEPYHLLKDFLRVGQVCIISGAAKTNKSWTMMELALAVSQGKGKFIKWSANVGKVYYIDTELEKFDFKKRMKAIAHQVGASPDPGEFGIKLIRGIRTNLDKLVPQLIRKLKGKGYDLICIDAIYSILGDREENANEDISEIGALLFELAKGTGAAVIFSHHFSKGNQGNKRGIEKASGAGSWGRFPDVSLSIDRPNKDGELYNIEPTFRSFPPMKPFVAERINSVWEIKEGMPTIQPATAADVVSEILDVLVNECGGEASPGDWFKACEATLGITRDTFDKRKSKATRQKLAKTIGKTSKTICKIADGVRKDSDTGEYRKTTPADGVKFKSAEKG